MVLLGWGLARGLLSLAGVGLAFHLSRRKWYLEKQVLELNDDNKELRGLHEKALQGAEQMKETLCKDVDELEKQIQEYEEKLSLAEKKAEVYESLNKEYKEKLSLAEKKAEEYESLNKIASEDIKQLKCGKQELESSLESALRNLQKREEELMASSARNRNLEDSMLDATEKVKETQHAFAAYIKEAEVTIAAGLERAIKKEWECDELAAQNDEMQSDIALLQEQEIQNVREAEGLNRTVESLGKENRRLQKQIEDLKAQLECYVRAIEVPTAETCPGEFFKASRHGYLDLNLDASNLKNHSQLPLPAMKVPTAASSMGEMPKASHKNIVTSSSAEGSVNLKQRSRRKADRKEEAENERGDDEKLSSSQNLGSNWHQDQGHERLLPFYKSPQQEIDKSKVEIDKASGSSSSMNHEIGTAPSETSKARPRLGRDRIATLNNLLSSCSGQATPYQGREVKTRSNPKNP